VKSEEVVKRYIEQHELLRPDGHYLVAVSGGADSVCLLLMLQQLGYQVEAVHCNFHLRGDESQRDEEFVKNLCSEKQITIHLTHFDTKTYADQHQVSIEMAARNLRYHYFEQLRCDLNADDICVAHHSDDQAETVLMNLLRGSGLRGLQGIRPRNGHIVRPLLCLSRADIEAWLAAKGQPYVTDSTNLQPDILRNYLRLNVIPQLQQLVPAAKTNILTTASHVSEALRVYDAATSEALHRLTTVPDGSPSATVPDGSPSHSIPIAALLHEPSPESLLYEWLNPCGFNGATIEAVASHLRQPMSGKLWTSDTHELCVHRGQLLLRPIRPERPTLRIPETGTYVYDDATRFSIRLTYALEPSRQPLLATLDAATVNFPLTIRPAQTADRFIPFGMKGSKLVSDYLTNRHLSLIDKRRQLVVADDTGRIVWLVGHRIAAPCAISETTRQVLTIEVQQTS